MQQKKKPRAKYLFTQRLVEAPEKLLPEKKDISSSDRGISKQV